MKRFLVFLRVFENQYSPACDVGGVIFVPLLLVLIPLTRVSTCQNRQTIGRTRLDPIYYPNDRLNQRGSYQTGLIGTMSRVTKVNY